MGPMRAREQQPTQRPRALRVLCALCALRSLLGLALRWAWSRLWRVLVMRVACWAMAWLRAGPSSGRPRPMLIRTIRFPIKFPIPEFISDTNNI